MLIVEENWACSLEEKNNNKKIEYKYESLKENSSLPLHGLFCTLWGFIKFETLKGKHPLKNETEEWNILRLGRPLLFKGCFPFTLVFLFLLIHRRTFYFLMLPGPMPLLFRICACERIHMQQRHVLYNQVRKP